ncbi:SagB-type dehydrogenase family enzyme [Sporomusaceae bacterium BoRhaA]|uniref:SagB/ThcOx family dehydrogenase n=1 Tax=Pelorhabdus rhamnosifermentans TaxID=2772457 RepID=UPI001C062264|nr:SagB/ThcOx family dehydrogenase [Pelorhabdus rhamnosifermentans]MBU2699289.1 SagB-type dehydrogenase family enzyme [Pelorhabdus rhamnosifermentans]
MSNEINSKTYYWSPSVHWNIINNELKIETLVYPQEYISFFPKLYFYTQRGCTLDDLINKFPENITNKLKNFLRDLIRKKILVCSLLTPQELYYPQNRLFKNKYNNNILFDPAEYEKFKNIQLNRNLGQSIKTKIQLNNKELPKVIRNRRTYRIFDEKVLLFKDFGNLLSIFKQNRVGSNITYFYASAGGLYPMDIYIYVKHNRIERLKQGFYYYNPVKNALYLINDKGIISENAHYRNNKKIFKSSAFSLFFIYNAEVTMPKYLGMGYFFASIDTGVMVATLTQVAEMYNIGLCSIGDMNFSKIEEYFNLNENQLFIHAVECGLKPTESIN